MKKRFLLLTLAAGTLISYNAKAAGTVVADTAKAAAAPAPAPDPPLVFSGSVDTYYKYDFSGHGNIPTSFANENNSFSIGMIDLGLKKTVGKASFVGELSFGPRGQSQSLPADITSVGGASTAASNSYHIQNLYVNYAVTDKFSLAMGYMATFIGYEVISPASNFNYSTSYLFTNGPFQNAGFKATYAFSSSVSLMAGVFNDLWNVYQSSGKINTFGAQLTVTPVKDWTAYINLATGPASGTEVDLTTAYQITTAFKLGLNAANFKAPNNAGGFSGIALYPQLAVSSAVTIGLRGEDFKYKNDGGKVNALTVTANIKAGPLTFIPEVRFDNKSSAFPYAFVDSNGASTNTASQFLFAAVYAF